jgi:hypothetical protein
MGLTVFLNPKSGISEPLEFSEATKNAQCRKLVHVPRGTTSKLKNYVPRGTNVYYLIEKQPNIPLSPICGLYLQLFYVNIGNRIEFYSTFTSLVLSYAILDEIWQSGFKLFTTLARRTAEFPLESSLSLYF